MNYLEFDVHISPLYPGRDLIISDLAEVGFESFLDTDQGCKAYIQEADFEESEVLAKLKLRQEEYAIRFEWKVIENQNWNAQWESDFEEIDLNDGWVIRAPFHTQRSENEVIIAPKMSFGTGHHPTTFLMSNALLATQMEGKSVLDMGSGTGVLAILAKKRGAGTVFGVEIEPHALENAQENEALNQIQGIHWRTGGVEQIPEMKFDLVLANINRNVLLELIPTFAKVMTAGTELWLSGFFESDVESLVNKGETAGFKKLNVELEKEWALLKMEKL